MVALAFSVYSNKGVYALLLGSGVSRSSGIPTGWEIVLDLLRKVARLEGQDPKPDPAAWFRRTRGAEPDYSKLLDAIATTSVGRHRLLRSYFEPTDEERAQGLKEPSAAHHAIARLASAGYLRVVLTTNFDRLMERALDALGITPTVICTTDQLAGSLPLVHSGITVIKLNGDYLDTRIKNTERELATYDDQLNALLDRILDEYGLIVCGWSGDWDPALRAAIRRSSSHRFTTYWATRSPLSDKAEGLAKHRGAVLIRGLDADRFFGSLKDKIQALEDGSSRGARCVKIAAATVKEYIVEPTARIRLRDLLHQETEKLVLAVKGQDFDPHTRLQPSEEVSKRVDKYRALCDRLLSLLITGSYWGDVNTSGLWASSLQRVANSANRGSGLVLLLCLQHYPALLLLYGAGLASIAGGRLEALAILLRARVRDRQGEDVPFCVAVHAVQVLEATRLLPGFENRHTPTSDHLFEVLREPMREFLPDDEDYEDAFDRLEYLIGLAHADLTRGDWEDAWWGPLGRFAWRGRSRRRGNVAQVVGTEIESQGAEWPLIRAGLFDSSLEQARKSKSMFDTFVSRCHF